MSNELLKEAAAVMKTLKEERNALIEKEKNIKFAFDITKKMIEMGKISHANSLEKFAELQEKSQDDLKILEKALEISGSSDIYKIGSLSDHSVNTGDAKTQFMNYLLDDKGDD